jgi:hypothetical protein
LALKIMIAVGASEIQTCFITLYTNERIGGNACEAGIGDEMSPARTANIFGYSVETSSERYAIWTGFHRETYPHPACGTAKNRLFL